MRFSMMLNPTGWVMVVGKVEVREDTDQVGVTDAGLADGFGSLPGNTGKSFLLNSNQSFEQKVKKGW